MASARWLEYNEERIFEILPEALSAIHKTDRYGSVVIEADADPTLRHAYPYDHRVFVMPLPETIHDVFRRPECAADELHRVLDDTAAFASEMFGLRHHAHDDGSDPHEDRPSLSTTHMRSFLYSPLGDELATRIQLEIQYHGLVESDIILVNSGLGSVGPQTDACIKRIEQMLERLRGPAGRETDLFRCDPSNRQDSECLRLLSALEPLCQGGK